MTGAQTCALPISFGVNLVALLSNFSAWWHLAGVAVIVLALAFIPADHQTLSWTFFHYVNQTGWSFWASPVYVFLIGLLMAQYTYTGFDASAHISERPTAPPPTLPRAS